MPSGVQSMLFSPTPVHARALVERPKSPRGLKQLVARRGSVSAPDPFGARKTPPPRCILTRLTIVRTPPPKANVSEVEKIGSRRNGQNTARTASPTPSSSSRLSFASASFSPPGSPKTSRRSMSPRPASPSWAPYGSTPFATAGRSQSPLGGRHSRSNSLFSNSATLVNQERLTPGQVHELAKMSSKPTTSAISCDYALPALFTELEDDAYLPFVDRPSEVHELISSGNNAKTLLLLARMLPSTVLHEDSYPRTSAELAATVDSWTFDDFTTWLTQVTREEIDDVAWAHALRRFVLPKSEVLWERVKSICGIPPDLDVESFVEPTFHDAALKQPVLNISPIHPAPYTSALQLDEISETAKVDSSSSEEQVLGMRIFTSPTFPPSGSRSISPSPHTYTRSRTTSQSSVPLRSSPLVPTTSLPHPPSACGLRSSVATVASSSTKAIGLSHKRKTSSPMFPTSFAKLGLQPTLFSVSVR